MTRRIVNEKVRYWKFWVPSFQSVKCEKMSTSTQHNMFESLYDHKVLHINAKKRKYSFIWCIT